jgi:hypothetical protein
VTERHWPPDSLLVHHLDLFLSPAIPLFGGAFNELLCAPFPPQFCHLHLFLCGLLWWDVNLRSYLAGTQTSLIAPDRTIHITFREGVSGLLVIISCWTPACLAQQPFPMMDFSLDTLNVSNGIVSSLFFSNLLIFPRLSFFYSLLLVLFFPSSFLSVPLPQKR